MITIGLAIATRVFRFRTMKHDFGLHPGATRVSTAQLNGI